MTRDAGKTISRKVALARFAAGIERVWNAALPLLLVAGLALLLYLLRRKQPESPAVREV